jgi:hypothetical protein
MIWPVSLATRFQSGFCFRGRNQIMPRSKLIDFLLLNTLRHLTFKPKKRC